MKDIIPDSWIMGEHLYQRQQDEAAEYDPREECESCLELFNQVCRGCGLCRECCAEFKVNDCEGDFDNA